MTDADFYPDVSGDPASYPEVENAHVIPKMWLNRFAAPNEMIQSVLVKHGKSVLRPTKDAGVRKRQYSRTRPGGGRIDDIEWGLAQLEGPSAAELKGINENWPLSFPRKGTLAQLFAFQLVRSPRWIAWDLETVSGYLTEWRAAGEFLPRSNQNATEEEIFRANSEHYLSKTQALIRMQTLGYKASNVLGSMSWTLLSCPEPWLALSDHPVVVWPMRPNSRRPQVNDVGSAGLMQTLEVRVPVSPTQAVLMTWRHEPDSKRPVPINKPQAESLNAFTIAEADLEWFHHPEHPEPRTASGQLLPLGPALLSGYSLRSAVESPLRAKTQEIVDRHQGRGLESLDENNRYIAEMVYLNEVGS